MPLYPNGLGTGVASNVLDRWIPGSMFIPSITSGPSTASNETTTHKVDFDTYDFDPSTSEQGEAWVTLPSAGTFTAEIFWTVDSGSGSVVWAVSARAYTDGDPMDSALGTAQQVTDTLLSAGQFHDSVTTPSVTVGGVPAAGKLAVFRIARLTADGADNLGTDARLKGVLLRFNP